jgi:hypothetical protein
MDLDLVIIFIPHATIEGKKIIHTYPYPLLHSIQWKKDTNHEPQMFHTNGKQKETYFYKLAHTFAQLSQSHTSLAPFILSLNLISIVIFSTPTSSLYFQPQAINH